MIPAVFKCASDGIAWEEALHQSGRPCVILWRAEETALVVPRSWARREGSDIVSTEAARHGWPLLLRSSGGGAVPQGPGTLNLAMVVPVESGFVIEQGYREICGTIAEALNRFEVATDVGGVEGAFCDGEWNVTSGGKKLAGTAQRWRRQDGRAVVLIHAAILVECPPEELWPVLEQVQRIAGPSVPPRPDVHTALKELLPAQIDVQSVYGAFARAAADRLMRVSTISPKAA